MGYKIVYTKPKIVWVSTGILSNTLDSNAYSPNLVNDRNMILNSGMEIHELKDVINGDFITGSTPNYSENIIENGAVLLKTVNIYSNYLDDSKLFYISNSIHENRLRRSQIKKGDIILTVIGATDEVVGRAVVYNGNPEKANITQSLCKFGVNQKYDNYYISTFINSKYGHSMILQMAASSTRRYINNADLGTLLIPIPSPGIQRYIGDKVRKAEELREEAKRLIKEAEELFNQNYEQIIKNDSKFEWVNSYYLNEDNVIPNFYKQYQLLRDKRYAYIEFVNSVESIKCGVPVRSDMRIGNTYPFYGASGVTDNIGNYNFNGEYLIIAQDGSIGSVNVARNKFWANNHVWVVQVKEGWDLEFLELYLGKYNYWISLTTGSVVPKVTSENLKKLLVPKINYEVQKSIGDKIREAKHKKQKSRALIEQAKQDVENLIEGNFSMK